MKYHTSMVALGSNIDGYDEAVVSVMIVVLNVAVPFIGLCVLLYKHVVLRWLRIKEKHARSDRCRVFMGLPAVSSKKKKDLELRKVVNPLHDI